MIKWTISAICLMILAACVPTYKTDNPDNSIKICANVDGSGEDQTYPCQTVNLPYYPEKYVIYFRGSDAGCPSNSDKDHRCIDVDDWYKSDS